MGECRGTCRRGGGKKRGGWITRRVGEMEQAMVEEGRAPQVEDAAPSMVECRPLETAGTRPLATAGMWEGGKGWRQGGKG